MANGLYVPYRNGILGSYTTWVDLNTDTIRAQFLDTGTYTVNLTTHDFLDDIAGAGRVATSGLPLTPNGGTVNILWDNGSFRIFAI